LIPKINCISVKGGSVTNLKDGFWCNQKFFSFLNKEPATVRIHRPWAGCHIFVDKKLPVDKAMMIEDGIVTTVFEVDWGLH